MSHRLRTIGKALFVQPAHAFAVLARRWPASTGVGCTVLKTAAADLFAQKVIEGKEQIDWRRNSVFSSFGFVYLGLWQYYLYAGIFPKIATRVATLMGERAVPFSLTFIDQCIHHPILYFPSFYLLRGYVGGETAQMSMEKCREDFAQNLKALWVVWVPTQYVNFKYVPTHLQVPFVAAVSAVWCVIMSVFRGESASVAQKEEVQRMTELIAAMAVAAAAAESAKATGGGTEAATPAPSSSCTSASSAESASLPATAYGEQQQGAESAQSGAEQPKQLQEQEQLLQPLPEPVHSGCLPLPVCRSYV